MIKIPRLVEENRKCFVKRRFLAEVYDDYSKRKEENVKRRGAWPIILPPSRKTTRSESGRNWRLLVMKTTSFDLRKVLMPSWKMCLKDDLSGLLRDKSD